MSARSPLAPAAPLGLIEGVFVAVETLATPAVSTGETVAAPLHSLSWANCSGLPEMLNVALVIPPGLLG